MKNFRFTTVAAAALLVVSLTGLTVLASGPSAGPTGGSVNPNFDSLSIGASASPPLFFDSTGVSNSSVNGSGWPMPVIFNDPQGISSTNSSASLDGKNSTRAAIYGEVTGSSGGYGVFAKASTGTSTALHAENSAAGSITADFVAGGQAVNATTTSSLAIKGLASGASGIGILGDVSADASSLGVYGRSTLGTGVKGLGKVGGDFVYNVGSGPETKLATSANAIEATGSSDLKGDIKNSDATVNSGMVLVSDTDGFGVTLPTAPTRFKVNGADGGILNPTASEPVKISDTDGVNIFGPLYNPTSYITLGNPNWNPSDYTGSNYVNLNQPIGNYASKPITVSYTATSCANDAGIASGGTCWYPLIVRDEEGIAMTVNTGSPLKRQTNLFIGSDGTLKNPGPNNGGDVTINDDFTNNGYALFHRTDYSQCDLSIAGSNFGLMNCPATDNAFHFLSLIDAYGAIGSRNSGATDSAPLKVEDDSGMTVGSAAGTVGIKFAANGDISNPSSYVTVADTLRTSGTNNALRLEGTGGYTSGAILNFGDSDYVHIAEPVDDYMDIKSTNFTVDTAGNLYTSGHARASGGFGTYSRVRVDKTLTSGVVSLHEAFCPINTEVTGCGYMHSALTSVNTPVLFPFLSGAGSGADGSTKGCRGYGYQTTGANTTFSVFAMCLNPNG